MKKNGRRRIVERGVREDLIRTVQRYCCCDCHRSFVSRQYPGRRISHELCEEIVRRHVEGGESYRSIARWMRRVTGRRSSPTRLQHRVEEVATRCKTALEMSKELGPRWDGVLLLDEKMCRVKGNRQWFYLAVDTTGDILHCRAVQELSSTTAGQFLGELEALPVKRKGVVTDLDPALVRAVSVAWPEIPHQYCLKHALAAIGILIGYVERNARRLIAPPLEIGEEAHRMGDEGNQETPSNTRVVSPRQDQRYTAAAGDSAITLLYKACQKILMAETEHQALVQYNTLRRDSNLPRLQQRKAVRFLKRHWNKLMTHHRVVGMPRTTNLVENVNKQLERRYKTIEAFQHKSTAIHYTNLLVAYLRQKPYTDCRGRRKHLNGKSRLASAKVRDLHRNWLKNCLKSAV